MAAGGSFLYWRAFLSHGAIVKIDARQCYEVVDAGTMYYSAGGAVLWWGALMLAVGSVLQGIVDRKLWMSVKGVLAFGIVFLNFVSMLSGRSMQIPERSVIANLRTINTAEVTYISVSGGTYGTIADLVRHDLLDPQFEQPSMGSYTFEVVPAPHYDVVGESHYLAHYLATATPVGPQAAAEGCWEYYSIEDAVIRFSTDPAKAPPGLAGMPIDR